MATAARRPASKRTTFQTGPFKGVITTKDPYDDQSNTLVDAQNFYIPDIQGGSGVYARRGFGILNLQQPYTGRGQGVFNHVVNVTSLNFVAAGGKLYRADVGLNTWTDVTPTSGVTIDPDSTHVYFVTFGEQLIISDGVNQPWIASNLTATPITGTVIDYNGTGVPNSGTSWSAFGQPIVYAGSLFFILNQVNGVFQRTSFTWSAPGNPAQGYQQDDGALNAFDYTWTEEQTDAHPINGLASTNIALFFFRDYFIGAATGTPGPDFQGSSSKDVVSVNVGCLQSATIQQYGQTIFFCDALGRPFALQPGSPPIPLWLSMRQVVEEANSQYPSATAQVACATIHPTLNLYLVALYSPVAGEPEAPIEMYAFDTKTLAYVGRWSIQTGATIEAMGILNDTAGYASLIVLGNEPVANVTDQLLTTESGLYLTTESGIRLGTVNTGAIRQGVIWGMDATTGDGDPITSEDGLYVITSEDGIQITSENRQISWLDDGFIPIRTATTQRMGYSADTVYNVDQCTVITENTTPIQVSITTPTMSNVLEGTPSPAASVDGTYRLVCGTEAQGRGIQVTVSPTTATDQFILQSIGVVAVPSKAGWEES